MRKTLISALVAGLAVTAFPAHAEPKGAHSPPPAAPSRQSWGRQFEGRWEGGLHAPGGWRAYRAPVAGFVLPPYWIQQQFFIPEPSLYGLPSPPPGFGWSRYYDDAVLTDAEGRVRESRNGIAWAYDEQPPPLRYATTEAPTYDGDYQGRWEGTWRDANGREYSGTYEGRFEGSTQGDWREPHWRPGPPPGPAYPAPGTIYGGYYYPAPTVTTIVVQPGTITTIETIEAAPAYSRRHIRRRQQRCSCK